MSFKFSLPERGSFLGYFLAVKAPWGAKVNFPRVNNTQIRCVPISSNFLRRTNAWIKSYWQKSVIFGHFGLFWPFLTPIWSITPQYEFSWEIRLVFFLVSSVVVGWCKKSEKSNGWLLRSLSHTHRHRHRQTDRCRHA